MRFLLFLGTLALLACRSHTLPITAMPAYAANQPVVTREGYALSLEDGGRVELLPYADGCLVPVGEPRPFPEPTTIGADSPGPCRRVGVFDVEHVTAGERLLIRGKTEAIEVDPELVQAIRILKPNLDATYFAPKTAPNRVGLIVGGSRLMAAGVAGSVALFTAAGNVDDGFANEIVRALLATYGAIALAGGLAGGIPMVVIGARRVRLPQAEQPSPVGLELGSGIGLRWRLE
ncbi:MAG: hypothetical protein JNK04_06425 [Myxococcales bacterium]|nr:hypothetical protein [Myxococcales bacterium]